MSVGEDQLLKFLNLKSELSFNRLYNLPFELQLFIFEIKEHEQVNLIINKWYWYLNKKIVLSQRIINMIKQEPCEYIYNNHIV